MNSTIKRNIAIAVHRAVCEFTNSDGCGRCHHYALAGWVLACSVLKREYILQAGSLYILADPPNGAVAFEPGKYGFQRGEFHCWFVAPGNDGKMAEFVDLSSRHYRRLVERGPQYSALTETEEASIMTFGIDRIQWTRKENPPEFIWTNGTFPDVMRAIPTVEATNYLNKVAGNLFEKYAPLVKMAWKHYAALTGQGVASPIHSSGKVGRNAACPCGSERKFKHCCMNKRTIPVMEKKL
jgi:hypothetical protein